MEKIDKDSLQISRATRSNSITQRLNNALPITSRLPKQLSILRSNNNNNSTSSQLSDDNGGGILSSSHSSNNSNNNIECIPIPHAKNMESTDSMVSASVSISPSSPNKLADFITKNVRKLSKSNSQDNETTSSLLLTDTAIDFNENEDIPSDLIDPGVEMLRITHKKKIKRLFKFDLTRKILKWNNKASSFLEMEKIQSIRTGDDAKNYREEFKISSEYKDLWITIIYYNYSKSNNIKALHLIATNKRNFDIFLKVLQNMLLFKRELNKSLYSTQDTELFTKLHWNSNQKSLSPSTNVGSSPNPNSALDKLTFEGVLKLANKLHIHAEKDYLFTLFSREDIGNKKYLNFDEFKKFVSVLRERDEFSLILRSLNLPNNQMSEAEFADFLVNIQKEGEKFSKDFIVSLFKKFSNSKAYMNNQDFGNFLISSYTSPFIEIDEDYTKPLNEYYISSSHNTYLLGRQFHGNSSIEGYIRALQRGCRCIEIDVWDGSDNLPVVTHGRTLTNSIDFETVIQTIRKYSFITSPYPVILSLEIKCNKENQLRCISILREVLNDLLILNPIVTDENILPSPLQLKHKVLVKVKKSKSNAISKLDGEMNSGSYSSLSTSSSISDDINSTNSIKKIISKGKKSVTVQPELSNLAVYLSGIKFRNFSLPESKSFNHCFSFSDRSIISMIKDRSKLTAILKHNIKFLIRIYPSIIRFKSDNFNPLLFWDLGCQLVATNWQIYDIGQQIYESLFNIGSHSGYILKPRSLRLSREIGPKLNFEENLKFNILNKLKINMISAQQLPKPKELKDDQYGFSPFIDIEIFNVKVIDAISIENNKNRDKIGSLKVNHNNNNNENGGNNNKNDFINISGSNVPSVIFKTSIVNNNGFNPIWNQSFQLDYYTNSNNLVFVRFVVKCKTSDHNYLTVGVNCCKLDYLRQGYRHIPIYDLQGEEFIYSSLFLRIENSKL